MKVGNLKNTEKPSQPKKDEVLPKNVRHVAQVSYDLNQVEERDDISVKHLGKAISEGRTVLLDNFYKNDDGTSTRKKAFFKETYFMGYDADELNWTMAESEALFKKLDIAWFLRYYSFSAVIDAPNKEDNMYKHRYFFKFDEPFNEIETMAFYAWLKHECEGIVDAAASDYARLWYGSKIKLLDADMPGDVNSKADFMPRIASYIADIEREIEAQKNRKKRRKGVNKANIVRTRRIKRYQMPVEMMELNEYTGTDSDRVLTIKRGHYLDENIVIDYIEKTVDTWPDYMTVRYLMGALVLLEINGYSRFIHHFYNLIDEEYKMQYYTYINDFRDLEMFNRECYHLINEWSVKNELGF